MRRCGWMVGLDDFSVGGRLQVLARLEFCVTLFLFVINTLLINFFFPSPTERPGLARQGNLYRTCSLETMPSGLCMWHVQVYLVITGYYN